MLSLYNLIDTILGLYMWVIIVGAVMSWLVAFEVVNTRNRFVGGVVDFTYRLTEPAMRPIRRVIPSISGIDLSPIILILGIMFARDILRDILL